jgi:hypothetical protein
MIIFSFRTFGIALALILTAGQAFAQSNGAIPAPSSVAGVVTHLSGLLRAKSGTGASRVLAVRSEVMQGDTLITEKDTYARIKFSDNGEVVLRPGTQLTIEAYAYDAVAPANDNIVLSLLKGGLRAVTGLAGQRNHDVVKVNTPTATIGIRGTNFGAIFCQADCAGVPTGSGTAPAATPPGLYVDVSQGAIVLSNPAGSAVFTAGQFGYTPSFSSPPVMVPANVGLPFTMPPSISLNAPATQSDPKANMVNCTVR